MVSGAYEDLCEPSRRLTTFRDVRERGRSLEANAAERVLLELDVDAVEAALAVGVRMLAARLPDAPVRELVEIADRMSVVVGELRARRETRARFRIVKIGEWRR